MSPPRRPCTDFNWVFEYQPIASEILHQQSRYKKAERKLLADEKEPKHWILVVISVIYIYRLIVEIVYLWLSSPFTERFFNQE